MKITNIEEFEKNLDFIFSNTFFNLKKNDQNKIKEELILASKEIHGTYEVMKEKLLNEFIEYDNSGINNKEKIIAIFKMLSDEEKIQILSDYLNRKIKNKQYEGHYVPIYLDVLLPILDILSQEQKIKVFSEIDIEELIKIMYRLNSEFNRSSEGYYKNYYNICKKVLEMSPEEERMQILLKFLNKDKYYIEEYLDVLLTIADSLSQEQKIRLFSKIDNEKLFEVMAELNIKFNKATFFNKKRKYYKKYYDICKKALEMKDLR